MVHLLQSGGMAEWLKAAVLKTVEGNFRGFESYFLRHCNILQRKPHPEKWPSGLRRHPAKVLNGQLFREFESLLLRQCLLRHR